MASVEFLAYHHWRLRSTPLLYFVDMQTRIEGKAFAW